MTIPELRQIQNTYRKDQATIEHRKNKFQDVSKWVERSKPVNAWLRSIPNPELRSIAIDRFERGYDWVAQTTKYYYSEKTIDNRMREIERWLIENIGDIDEYK